MNQACFLPPLILLQRSVHVGKGDDARDQVLAIGGLEDGHPVSGSWVEVQFLWRPGVLEHLPRIGGITVTLAVHEQLGGGDGPDLVIAQSEEIFWRERDHPRYLRLRGDDQADI